jgi:hypothetical protein
MLNSPGGIQAGGDVVIAADKRLVQSMMIRVSLESETPDAEPNDRGESVGISSAIALFDNQKSRIRFSTDYRWRDQQISRNRRALTFTYFPETPSEILGKPVEYLAAMDALVVNYSEFIRLSKLTQPNTPMQIHVEVVVNGVVVVNLRSNENPVGTLAKGQATLDVSKEFKAAVHLYAAAVSR